MRISTGLLAAIALAPSARADFTIVGTAPAVKPSPPATAEPPKVPPPQVDNNPSAARHRAPPQSALAQGFGERISLSFAVKQIVPLSVKVTYGRGVDPAALVDWKGGAAWDRVLLAAVNPLGLHLVITGKAVEIRK